MREVILGQAGQYKLREDGAFFKRVYHHNDLGEVIQEGWSDVPPVFGKCDYRGGGYYSVSASIGKLKTHRLHRLIARHFVHGYSEGLHVNHIDGDRANNQASNLEWVTHKQNMENAAARKVLGKHNRFKGKLSEENVLTIITLINTGKTNPEISALYGIDKSNISKIRNKDARAYPWLHHLIENPRKRKCA